MTRAELDERSGRVRLDRRAFEQLVDTEAPGARSPALAAVAADPRVRVGLDTVAEPVCRLRVAMAGADRRTEHEGWLAHDAAALLLSSADGALDFLTVDPGFLPAVLAGMLRLGPRTVGERAPVHVDEPSLGGLLDPDPGARAEAFASLAGTAASLAFRVDVLWSDRADEQDGRGLLVLDGQQGLYAFRLVDGVGELVPVTSTFVWTALCALLPDDQTLAGWLSTGPTPGSAAR